MARRVSSRAWLVEELKRWFTAPSLWVLALISALMAILSIYGTVETGADEIASGLADSQSVTELTLTMPFAGVLFTTFFGIISVGSDFDSKFSVRLLSLYRTPVQFITVKSVVAALLSTVIGGVTLIVGRVATGFFLDRRDIQFESAMSLPTWIRGYLVLYALGAVWGVALALIFRNSILAMGVHFLYQTVAESTIIGAFPNVGKWLPGGAQAAIVEDVSLPERLEFWAGVGLYAGWLIGIFLIASFVIVRSPTPPRGLLNRRDVADEEEKSDAGVQYAENS